MILIPFERNTFGREMKPKISGNNLTLEFDNLQSTLSKVAVEFYDYLSQSLYEKIVRKEASEDAALNEQALDYLQRAMLHFTLYQHVIYLISKRWHYGKKIGRFNDDIQVPTRSARKQTDFRWMVLAQSADKLSECQCRKIPGMEPKRSEKRY